MCPGPHPVLRHWWPEVACPERSRRDWNTFWKDPRCQMLPHKPGPPCPACSGCLLCTWPLRLVKLTSGSHSGLRHQLHLPTSTQPNLLPHRPVSDLRKPLMERKAWIRFWLLPGAEDPTCLAPPGEFSRPAFLQEPLLQDGRTPEGPL